tara:strand:+ start:121 stop:375 length:255 start_codon:yes stop_codon:yes gene_type:complete
MGYKLNTKENPMEKATFKGNKNDVEAIRNSFRNFDKWETYGLCFNALKSGGVTLGDIACIAWNEGGIAPDVIKMRMLQMKKMAN